MICYIAWANWDDFLDDKKENDKLSITRRGVQSTMRIASEKCSSRFINTEKI